MKNYLILIALLLAGCNNPNCENTFDVTVLSTDDKPETAWRCGSKGHTLIEFSDGTRESWCGQYGKVGDRFKSKKMTQCQ